MEKNWKKNGQVWPGQDYAHMKFCLLIDKKKSLFGDIQFFLFFGFFAVFEAFRFIVWCHHPLRRWRHFLRRWRHLLTRWHHRWRHFSSWPAGHTTEFGHTVINRYYYGLTKETSPAWAGVGADIGSKCKIVFYSDICLLVFIKA